MHPKNAKTEPPFNLAIETSGLTGSVTLGRGDGIVETRVLGAEQAHAAELLPAIDSLCKSHFVEPNQLATVFLSIGPGSFTGLRIGATIARMMALANGAKLVPVETLDVIAQNALKSDPIPDRVAVILDAKRGRVFAAHFDLQTAIFARQSEPAEVNPETFFAGCAEENKRCVVLGSGVQGYGKIALAHNFDTLDPAFNRARAENVHRLGLIRANAGLFAKAQDLLPYYVRPPEAEEKWNARNAKPTSA